VAKRIEESKPIVGRALVHRVSAGPMKSAKRDLPRGEARRRALREE